MSSLTQPRARPLSKGSPPTEIRRRNIFKFPSPQEQLTIFRRNPSTKLLQVPQDKHIIFRMQRDAPLNPCDSPSYRSHTSTLAWQSKGAAPIEDHKCCLCQSLLTLHQRACGPWLLGMSLDSRSRLPPCCLGRTFTVNYPKLSIFSPPGPTYRSTCGHSSGFTTDSPASESTVFSRYRPRSPSDFNRIAVDGHVADRDCIQFFLVKQPLFTRSDFNWYFVRSTFSLTRDVVLGADYW